MDASFQSDAGTTGYGICIRDHIGQFILAKTSHSLPMLGVSEGEAIVVLMALNWLHQLNVDFAIVETDCKLVVDNTNSSATDLTEFGDLIKSCKNFLSLKP